MNIWKPDSEEYQGNLVKAQKTRKDQEDAITVLSTLISACGDDSEVDPQIRYRAKSLIARVGA